MRLYSIQNTPPVFFTNIMIFQITTPATNSTSPSGFVSLNISGIVNPQSIGSSSSFIIQLLIPTLPGSTTSCQNCLVAQIDSGLIARSTVPGNIITLSFASTNTSINQPNNITIYSQLFASIP